MFKILLDKVSTEKTETIIRGFRVLEEIKFKTANTSAKQIGSKIYGCFGGVLS